MKKKIKKLDLAELILLAKGGDKAALAELVAREERSVKSTLYSLKADAQEVSDISQDVLIKMSKNIAKLKNPQTFKSWLKQITLNSFYDELRAKQRCLNTVSVNDEESCVPEPADYTSNPHNIMLKGELNNAIRLSIARLPPKYRRAIAMRELKGLSYEEIAAATGTGIGTVKSRIARAREKLQEELKNYMEK